MQTIGKTVSDIVTEIPVAALAGATQYETQKNQKTISIVKPTTLEWGLSAGLFVVGSLGKLMGDYRLDQMVESAAAVGVAYGTELGMRAYATRKKTASLVQAKEVNSGIVRSVATGTPAQVSRPSIGNPWKRELGYTDQDAMA